MARKKSLLSTEVYQDALRRIDRLAPESRPRWGSMTVAQMLAHCAAVQEVLNGKELRNSPFWMRLFKGPIRRLVFSESPFRRNAPTHPQYEQTEDRDFDTEKRRLLAELEKLVRSGEGPPGSIRHSLFGEVTREERGWMSYKHLDHHLNQFAV